MKTNVNRIFLMAKKISFWVIFISGLMQTPLQGYKDLF